MSAFSKLDVLLPSSFVRHLVLRNFASSERTMSIPSVERVGLLEVNTLTSVPPPSVFDNRGTPDGCFSWDALPNLVECQKVRWTTSLSPATMLQALPDFVEGCIRRNVRELAIDECTVAKPFACKPWFAR